MSLEFLIKPNKTELLMQEDTLVRVYLVNRGKEPVQVLNIAFNPLYPVFKVRRLETDETLVFRRHDNASIQAVFPNPLAPGQQLEWSFYLRTLVTFPAPGEYELVGEYEWGEGKGMARSEPIKFVLKEVAAQMVSFNIAAEPVTEEFYIFWMQPKGEGLELARSTVSNINVPAVTETTIVGPMPERVDLIPSIPANRGNPLSTWLVWLKGKKLFFRFVSIKGVAEEIHSTDMPDVDLRILSSPLISESTDCEVLLWMSTKGQSKLQLAQFNRAGETHPAAFLALPDPVEPLWSRTVMLKNQERRAYVILGEPKQVHLRMTNWKSAEKMEPLRDVITTPGVFVAAGAMTLEDDSVIGLLVTRPLDRSEILIFTPWLQRPDGSVEKGLSEEVGFAAAARVDRSLIRFNIRGWPFVALRPSGSAWQLRKPGESFMPVGGEAGTTQSPVALFLNEIQLPIFVHSKPGLGFFFSEPSGEPAQNPHRG